MTAAATPGADRGGPLGLRATLSCRLGAVDALREATLELRPGTAHALVGENGAGKSTMVRVLAGLVPGRGALEVGGAAVDLGRWTARRARAAGVGVVQQHGAFAPTLTVVENAVLGQEPTRLGGLALDAPARALRALGERVGLPVDPWAVAGALPVGVLQRAELVTALYRGARLLLLDEPTAVLTPGEAEALVATLRRLADAGTTVVLVTHKLDEVRALGAEVTVLRAGRAVATLPPSTPSDEIARAMVGAAPPAAAPPPPLDPAAPVALALRGVSARAAGGAVHGVDLVVRRGELVGVAGVAGNGQEALTHAIAGLAPLAAGALELGGRPLVGPAGARLAAGLAHVPEDRHHGGLLLDDTVAANLALGRADVTGRFRIDRAAVLAHARRCVAALDVRPPDPAAVVRGLSGGNQQKVVVARELTRPGLVAVVASQPTRGVDLGAVARIHAALRAAAAAGAGVLVVSADLDELVALCHRVVVLLRGRLVGEVGGAALAGGAARAALGELMTGARG